MRLTRKIFADAKELARHADLDFDEAVPVDGFEILEQLLGCIIHVFTHSGESKVCHPLYIPHMNDNRSPFFS